MFFTMGNNFNTIYVAIINNYSKIFCVEFDEINDFVCFDF